MTTINEETRRPGRPRSAKAHKAILEATTELLLEQGLQSMSMDELAERAGVSKATIYRWWASKELLALDALATDWGTSGPAAERDTGSLRGDLLAQVRPWQRKLHDKPYGRIIAGLVAQAQTYIRELCRSGSATRVRWDDKCLSWQGESGLRHRPSSERERHLSGGYGSVSPAENRVPPG